MPRQYPTLSAGLWNRVRFGDPDECWPYLGGLDRQGYGSFVFAGRRRKTHRIAYELCHGVTPAVVLHVCDNPPCCNPLHLAAGTKADNTHDMINKGRYVTAFVPGNTIMTGRKRPGVGGYWTHKAHRSG